MILRPSSTTARHPGAIQHLLAQGARVPAPSGRRIVSAWMKVGGARLHARAGGPAPHPGLLPVVMVHGFGVSGRYFVPTAWRLGREFPVYMPDLPGHGRSGLRGMVLDAAGLADALIGWLDAAGLHRVVLVGNSYGCQIVAHVAARHPDRVAGLVFVGPTLEPAYRPLHVLLPRFLAVVPLERPSLIPMQALAFLRFGLHRLARELRYLREDRLERVLPLVRAPVLIVRGGRDPVVSQAWAERLTASARQGELRIVEGRGHALNYSAPGALVRIVTPFLRALPHDTEPQPATVSSAPPLTTSR